MSFVEVRFPEIIGRGAEGGPFYNTVIADLSSGREQRQIAWPTGRMRFRVNVNIRPEAEIQTLMSFFRIIKGQGYGFRFKHWMDFEVTTSEGRLGTGGVGTGAPGLQLYKRYTYAGQTDDRAIRKPVSGGVSVFRNASPVSIGGGAGNIAIDYTTGTVTFVADQTRSISSHTVGVSHVFTLSSAFSPNLAIGGKIYVSGISGTAATTLNALSHTVTNVAGAVITTSTVTTGLTASGGTASFFPQPTTSLTWSGTFDVPVRMMTDWFRSVSERAHATWPDLEMIEDLDQ